MQNRIFIVVNYYSYNQSFIHLFDFRYFVFSTGTKSSENDRFCPIFVICTGLLYQVIRSSLFLAPLVSLFNIEIGRYCMCLGC